MGFSAALRSLRVWGNQFGIIWPASKPTAEQLIQVAGEGRGKLHMVQGRSQIQAKQQQQQQQQKYKPNNNNDNDDEFYKVDR